MSRKVVIIIFAVIFMVSKSSDAVPCSKIVKIQSKELYSYLASVTFAAPKTFHGVWKLNLKTHVPFLFLGGWDIVIHEDGPNGQAEIQSAEEIEIRAGDEIRFNFRISWNPDYDHGPVIPLIQSITWQGQPVCSSVGRSSVLKKPQIDSNSIVKRHNKFLRRIQSKYYD